MDEIVSCRIRNRIIDYLEIAASPAEQRCYEAAVPLVHVPHELINQWEDWVHGDPEDWPEDLPASVYSADEVRAMQSFHATWDSVASRTPDPLPSLTETQGLPEWAELCTAARDALLIFRGRGKLDE